MQTATIINKQDLLNNIAEFYHKEFMKTKKGKEYLCSKGIYDNRIYEEFKIGYANGSLHNMLPRKEEIRKALKEFGLLDDCNKETISGVIFPIYNKDGNCTGFHNTNGRKAGTGNIYNWDAFRQKELILVKEIIETLYLCQIGYPGSIPLYNSLTEEHVKYLEMFRPRRIYLTFEDETINDKLSSLGIQCYKLNYSVGITKEEYEKNLINAVPILQKISGGLAMTDGEKLIFEFGNRKYQIKEIEKQEDCRMKVNIRILSNELSHIDTLDLYVSKSRSAFCNTCGKLLNISAQVIEKDLTVIIERIEKAKELNEIQSTTEQEETYKMTEEEEQEALSFLKQPDILDLVVKHLDMAGYVGEEINKKIGYLITISRKIENPLSGIIISASGAGKSMLMEQLYSFVPAEDLVIYTRITPQALYYKDKRSLKHKLIIAGEEAGIFGADYSIRELISSKKLTMAAPIRDSITGKMKTVEYEVEGPIALLFSTTQTNQNHENETRFFILSLDETQEQTLKVHQKQRESKTLEGILKTQETENIRHMHQNTQRLLRPLMVVNPYALDLTFPYRWINTRREQTKYLSLIETIAFLYQYQREIKTTEYQGRKNEYIEVEISDIEKANELMSEILCQSLQELKKPSKELLKQIKQLVFTKCNEHGIEPQDYRFNRRDIREYTGWSDHQVRSYLKKLVDLQYIIPVSGNRGRMFKYELAYAEDDGKKLVVGLTDTEKLKKRAGNESLRSGRGQVAMR